MAAATAIIGTGLALGSSAMSFSQYSQQNKAQKEAEAAAEKAMKEARDKLEENVFKGLDINLKSFERERDALAGVGAQLVTAGQESERGAAATAGRVAMASAEQAQNIQDREIDALEQLEQTIADQESRLQAARVNLDLGEVQGAQLAARDAQEQKNLALSQGVQSLAQAGLGISEMASEYANSAERKAARLERRAGRQTARNIRNNLGGFGQYKSQGGTMNRKGFRSIGGGSMVGDTLRSSFDALKSVGSTLLSPLLSVFGGDK